ncbi:MAG: hypothetical protein WC421_04455 [Elusimicrobiales bacterium]
MISRKFLIPAIAGGTVAGILIFARLAVLPGISADEAWFGIEALDMRVHGLFSPYASNWYTSTLYPWLISKVFAHFPPSVFALRFAGAAQNTAAAALAVYFAGLFFGRAAALAMSVFMVLPFYALFSRHAYEVCGLQNTLTVCALVSMLGAARRGSVSLPAALVFVLACYMGTLNHLMAVSVPLGLSVGFFAHMVERKDSGYGGLCALSWAALFSCAAVVIIRKISVPAFYTMGASMESKCGFSPAAAQSLAFWMEHKTAIVSATLALPAVAAAVFWKWQEIFAARLSGLAVAFGSDTRLRGFVRYAALAGLLAFLWFHATAFLGMLSGFNVFKYFFSLDAGFWAGAPLLICAGLIAGWVFSGAWRVAADGGAPAEKRVMAVMLLGYFASFTLLRNTNIPRYYLIPFVMFAFGAAAFVPEHFARSGMKTRAFVLACFALSSGILLRELYSPRARPMIVFKSGWHKEDSQDQTSNIAFFTRMRADGVCITSASTKIAQAAKLFYNMSPYPCRVRRAVDWDDVR